MSSSDLDRIFRLKDEKDWVLWKFQISILFKHLEVFDIVTGTKQRPAATETAKLAEYEKCDVKAQRAISSTLEREPLLHIVNCKGSAEMWTKLKTVYEQKSETSVHFLQQKFFFICKRAK